MDTQELYSPAYRALVEEERRLAAVCATVTSATDFRELARARAELSALRDVMAAFSESEKVDPAAVRAAERERHRARYVGLAEEAAREAEALAKRFIRAYLSPSGHAAVDYATGETFEGKPFKWSDEAVEAFTPIFVKDLYEGWLEAGGSSVTEYANSPALLPRPGLSGAAKRLPSFVGVNTQRPPERRPRATYAEDRRERY
jgi:hypothetical protein